MGQETSEIEWVTIKTTLPVFPLPPNEQRKPVTTARLILRPFNDNEDDLKALHALRADPGIMRWSVQGRVDKDLDETRQKNFALQVHPNDTQRYNLLICLASTGEVIGNGGNGQWKGELGWPELGYTFLSSSWGKGYATEFLQAFLKIWWELPREEVEVKVDAKTVRGQGPVKNECIVAVTEDANAASHRVLQKTGFEMTTLWHEADTQDSTKQVALQGWIATDPSKGA
jgi:RimJ/RimL family protein N-acetyltransferase